MLPPRKVIESIFNDMLEGRNKQHWSLIAVIYAISCGEARRGNYDTWICMYNDSLRRVQVRHV